MRGLRRVTLAEAFPAAHAGAFLDVDCHSCGRRVVRFGCQANPATTAEVFLDGYGLRSQQERYFPAAQSYWLLPPPGGGDAAVAFETVHRCGAHIVVPLAPIVDRLQALTDRGEPRSVGRVSADDLVTGVQ